VLHEGLLLSVIGIPMGIIVGLLIELLGTSIITNLLKSMSSGGTLNVDSEELLNFSFAAPPIIFIVAIVTSLGTVLLSAWIPARKASRISAIEAIRSTGEVKLKRKDVRTSKIPQMLFGFEGALAAKSLKRSRRNFRATVVSLTISVVLLVISGSFSSLIKTSSKLMFPNIDATAMAYWRAQSITKLGEITDLPNITLGSESAEAITKKLRNYDNAEIFGVGDIQSNNIKLPNGTETNGSLVSVDARNYEELCKIAGVPLGSNILVNLRREKIDGKMKEYAPYDFSEFESKTLIFPLEGKEPKKVTINGQLIGQQVLDEIAFMSTTKLVVIVPKCELTSYQWFAKVDDVKGFTKYGNQVLNELAPKSADKIKMNMDSVDIAETTKQVSNMADTIMIFVYGFVGMLTLIAVTSVISTISTNIRSRAGEFAVLESIGMAKSGVKKMLNLESVLCSLRSLVYGIPLGLMGAYGLYRGMALSVNIPFSVPLFSIVVCVLGVFAVTWVTMRYSASRLKRGSIIEAIRGE
jgi:putative ABC transport system permease protein